MPGRAIPQRFNDEGFVLVHGKNDHARGPVHRPIGCPVCGMAASVGCAIGHSICFWVACTDLPRHLQPMHARHAKIQKENVRMVFIIIPAWFISIG